MEDGACLGRRSSCDSVEAALLVRAELACALRDVQHDRGRRAVELVFEMGPALGQLLDDRVAEVEHLEGALIDVETFVIE